MNVFGVDRSVFSWPQSWLATAQPCASVGDSVPATPIAGGTAPSVPPPGCFFEAVGFAVDCDDLGVVDKAIDQGGDAGRGGEDLAPFGEWAIGRDQSALVLIAT